MQLERLHQDGEAVSPVIGVVLMLGITVILATIVGVFALGFGTSGETTPSAQISLTADESAETITATHNGGDPITDDNTAEIVIRGDGDVQEQTLADLTEGNGLPWSAGESLEWEDDQMTEGDEVRLVWEGEKGSGAILRTTTVS